MDVAPAPMAVGLLRTAASVVGAQRFAQLVEQFGLVRTRMVWHVRLRPTSGSALRNVFRGFRLPPLAYRATKYSHHVRKQSRQMQVVRASSALAAPEVPNPGPFAIETVPVLCK